MYSEVASTIDRLRRAARANMALSVATALLLALVAVQIIYTTRNYYFFSDDFLNFALEREMGPWPAFFFRDWIGEFIPLFGVFHAVYMRLFGVQFWPFRVSLVLMQWSLILMTAWFGHRRRISPAVVIPAMAILACSPIYGTLFQWYSAALQVLCEGMAGLAAIYVMAYRGRLSRGRFLLGSLLYLAAMFCFPKGLFLAAILFAVRMHAAFCEPGVTLRGAALRALDDVWLVAILGIGYAVNVVLGHHVSGVPHAGLALMLNYLWLGWNHGFVTGILGLDQDFPGHVALANIAVVGLVAATIVRDRRCAILWCGYAVYFLVALATIADNRAATFGLQSATTPRYYADMLNFFVAVTLIACTPLADTAPRLLTGRGIAAIAVLTVACCAFWINASTRIPWVWDRPLRNEVFVQNLKASLAKAAPDAKIADAVVPPWVMPPIWWPHTQYRYFLLLFKHHHGVVVPPGQAQFRFDADGNLVAVATNAERR